MNLRFGHLEGGLLLSVALLIAPYQVAGAQTVLRVEPEILGKLPGSVHSSAEEAHTATATIHLSTDGVLVVKQARIEWLDFGSGQYCMQTDVGQGVTYSIASMVAFKEMEIHNREMVVEQIGAMGDIAVGEAAAPIFADETELSMRAPKLGEPLTRVETDTQVDFEGEKRVWGAYSKEPLNLDDPDAPAILATYLRLSRGGHPDLLDEIAQLDFVPSWISTRVKQLDSTEVRLHLSIVTDADEIRPPDCSDVAPGNLAPIAALYSKARTLDEGDSKARATQIESEAITAFESGDPFSGTLCFMEAVLMRPTDEIQWTRDRKTEIENDPLCRRLFALLEQPSSKEHVQEMLDGLAALRDEMGSRAYLADVWSASLQLQLGQIAEARALFQAALSANPLLAGAWMDLGNTYWAEWDTFSAVGCFSIARATAPNHGLVARYLQYEDSLRERFPEFFQPAGR